MRELWQFYVDNYEKLMEQVIRHLNLTLVSVLLACAISIPLGVLIARKARLSGPVLTITGILQTIPSIALLGFLIPVLGIGMKPAIFALFLYSLLPIVRNVYTGINGMDANDREAARA
ncbi:MAG TPA: ABC transporter permease, partial [Cryomorphaceae bacterium]|nr:ABC transporter permease [Cryomorphaceae bacterium]